MRASLRIVLLSAVIGALVVAPSRAQSSGKFDIHATKTRGISMVAGVPVSSWAQPVRFHSFKRRLGANVRLRRPYRESCDYTWRRLGLELNFATFGLPVACWRRSLQAGSVTSRRWNIRVGNQVYRVGDPRSKFPRRMKYWRLSGFQLASMPFLGRRSPTVMVKFGRKSRAYEFNLFFGGAGD